MKNKKGIRFDHILLGFLIISAFIIGGVMMIGDINKNYGPDAAGEFPDGYVPVNLSDKDFQNVTSTIDRVFNITQQAKNATFEGDISGGDQSWESMTKGSYSAIRLVKGSFELFYIIINDIGGKIGIPAPFIAIAFIAFIIMVVISIVYMIFRFIPK